MPRKRLVIGSAVLILLLVATAVVLYLSRPQPSDEEKIVRLVSQAQAAVERRNATGLTRLISKDYADSYGVSRQQLVAYIVQWMRSGEEVTVVPSISGLRIHDSFADLMLDVRVWRGREPSGSSRQYMMPVRLQNEDGQWRVISAEGWMQAQRDFMGEE